MIVVNGMEYRTLDQDLYANGKKVIAAYCNKKLVYPERENTWMLKVIGHINTIIAHDHAGESPSGISGRDEEYTYHGGDIYRAKGCFSLVLRSHASQRHMFYGDSIWLPEAKWPLNGSYSRNSSNGDIYGPGNAWLVFPYAGSTSPLIPDGGGIHPLLGSETMETHAITRNYYYGNNHNTVSAELLLHLDVSAPRICPWSSDEYHIGTGYPFLNAEATPHQAVLSELPGDVNGMHRMFAYKRDIYNGLSWAKYGLTGRKFSVSLAPPSRDGSDIICSHLKISTSGGYDVPYTIRGMRNGSNVESEYTFTQNFRILNIPITQLLYSGKEILALEKHLHPSLEDIIDYI